MSDSAIFNTEALVSIIEQAVAKGLAAANPNSGTQELLTTRELAAKLKVPESWVREQSRQGKIPRLKLGSRYVRFDFNAVLARWATTKALERAVKS